MNDLETTQARIPLRPSPGSIEGILSVPSLPEGVVVFAHGSGSSRFSPRNRFVAEALNAGRFATLLVDLLTPEEERYDAASGALRFDIGFLAQRLGRAMQWVAARSDLRDVPLGLFGASTGAAAALVAAAGEPRQTRAIVSRGGRPDLAGAALGYVTAPTLFIVGGNDTIVLEYNRTAMQAMRCATKLEIISGAGHLFEEPGTLEQVARLAEQWFATHLPLGPRER